METETKRGGNPRWVKGVSGNPAGRPKLADEFHEVRAYAQQHTHKAINVLVRSLDDDDPRVRIVAALALLDRGWGKPHQSSDITVTGNITLAAALQRLPEIDRREIAAVA